VNGDAQHAFWIVIDMVLGISPFERFHLDWEKPLPILPGLPISRGEGNNFLCSEFSPFGDKKKGW
jgi:hypothetical protein